MSGLSPSTGKYGLEKTPYSGWKPFENKVPGLNSAIKLERTQSWVFSWGFSQNYYSVDHV